MVERIALRGTGKFLRKLRLHHELTLTEVARKLRMNKGTLSKLELDQIGISLLTIGKLAKLYSLPESSLLASILQHRFPKMTLNENIPPPPPVDSHPYVTRPLPEALMRQPGITP